MLNDFLKTILEVVKYFRFIRIVRANMQGVRKTLGKIEGPLSPGWYWSIPGLQEVEIETTLLDSVEVWVKSVTTRDDVAMLYEAVVWFRIDDAYKHWTTINNHKSNLAQKSAGYMNLKIRRRTWDSVRTRQRRLEIALRDFCASETASWGTIVTDARFTQLAKARPIRIIGALPKE